MPSDPSLLPAKIAAARAAIVAVTSNWTYAGFNVGSRIPADDFDELAAAVVNAVDDVENAAPPSKGKKP
jgi:hypothetical protein